MATHPAGDHRPAPLNDVAIVGIACVYPGANDVGAFWQNIVAGKDAIIDAPPDRVPPTFIDATAGGMDHTYCGRGGFIERDVPFDPLQYGVMPVITEGGDPEQFLALKVASTALSDAGCSPDDVDGSSVEVILGRGNYPNRGLANAAFHASVVNQVVDVVGAVQPSLGADALGELRRRLIASLPAFNRDTAASLVPNFTTARIANRLDFMGINFTVDAACASSLLALDIGVRDLATGKCDVAVAGGVFLLSDLLPIVLFTQLNALSRRSEIRPFDQDADGTLMGEGVGILILKRLADARAAHDRIYAVIKGVGSASDGRAVGLLAPRVDGEELALRRAYAHTGIDPRTIALLEAHGTATAVGDATEVQALTRVFGGREPDAAPHCALGTVKSMIGHAMPAAGAAGVIKAALALYHKVLPPTLHCEHPNPKLGLEHTPFYINTAARPWIHAGGEHPRRAGVNAFGFGGVNAHVILEEYRDEREDERPSLLTAWPSEAFVIEAPDRVQLIARARSLADYVGARPTVALKDVAATLNTRLRGETCRLALVASSAADLQRKIERACKRLADVACAQIKDPSGIYFFADRLAPSGKLAFLFPGEGSQYVGMLSDLAMHFPSVRRVLDRADGVASLRYLYPTSDAERREAEHRLWSNISGAVHAVLTADQALLALVQQLGLQPDAVLGHSSGDFIAALAAGVAEYDDAMSRSVHQLWMHYDAPVGDGGAAGLLAVGADAATALAKLGELASDVVVAMDNCPHQVVLAGDAATIDHARERLLAAGVVVERLAFDRPYHTSAFAPQIGPVREFLEQAAMRPARCPIYSCTSADRYPGEATAFRRLAIAHWLEPVRFQETIRRMYADGARLFLEVGPGSNLTAFVDDILRGKPYLALSTDSRRRDGLTQLNHVVAALSASGVAMRLEALYERRSPRLLDLASDALPAAEAAALRLAPVRLTLPPGPDEDAAARTPGAPAATPPPAEPAPASDLVPSRAAGPTHERTALSAVATAPASADLGWVRADAAVLATNAAPSALPAASRLAPAAVTDAAEPMLGYLRTMDEFLTVQQAVMEAFMAAPAGLAPTEAAGPPALVPNDPAPAGAVAMPSRRFPLLGQITHVVPGQELRAERTISPEADLFLRDHVFGRQVSTDPTLRPLAVVPMTVSVEIMAEAAAALWPGLRVVGLHQVRSFRWLTCDEGATTLRIEARSVAADGPVRRVEAAIWESGGDGVGAAAEAGPAAKATILLADAYPHPPAPAALALRDARPSTTTLAELYRYLFHGPSFHAIRSLREVGADGLVGELAALPLAPAFGPDADSALILDPVLLDAVGQLLGAWAYERVDPAAVIFPIQVAAITCYGPRLGPPAALTCRLREVQLQHRHVQATMDLLGPDGALHARLEGWQDFRFHVPAHRVRLFHEPRSALVGEVWEAPTAGLPADGRYVACLVDGVAERGSGTMGDVVAHIVLSRAEREQWRTMRGPAPKRTEWLLGRIAVKDAVRTYLRREFGLELYPADVEVTNDAAGRPRVGGAWAAGVPVVPAVTLAHTGLLAAAIAGGPDPDAPLGIDLEQIRPRAAGFDAAAFAPAERVLLDTRDPASREEWATRFWCAKEAVAKAAGHGLLDGPTGVTVERANWETGQLQLRIHRTLARLAPELGDGLIIAHTARADDRIVASTSGEKGEQR